MPKPATPRTMAGFKREVQSLARLRNSLLVSYDVESRDVFEMIQLIDSLIEKVNVHARNEYEKSKATKGNGNPSGSPESS